MDVDKQKWATAQMVTDEQLTEDNVRNYIAYGQLIARLPSRSEGWSDAYTMIQKIIHLNGDICKNWYRHAQSVKNFSG